MRRVVRFAFDAAMVVPAIIGYHVIIIWPTRYMAWNLSLGDEPRPVDKPRKHA